MKKITLLFLLISSLGFAQFTSVPSPAIASGIVTLNFNKTGTPLSSNTGTIYAHIGLTVNGTRWQNVKGTWGNNPTQPALTLVSGTNYKLELTPDLYSYFGVPTSSSITEICVVLRNDAGNMQTADTFINVGAFQASLNSPAENSSTVIVSGGSLSISATNTGGNASYVLKANGTNLNTNTTTSSYTYTHTNITTNQNYELVVTQGTTTVSKKFSVLLNPGAISAAMPSGLLDGINYNSTDVTKATLVLDAPLKDFVYVAGSFNSWQPDSNYAMKKDPSSGKLWLELSGLTSGENYTYQYWVFETTPIAGTPSLVKTADPYSTLVLSPNDDPYIPSLSYPNRPAYPAGQEREVTVLQTGQTPYAWSTATTNFVKPEKENLVVYELLVRDFDAASSYQSVIDRIDYFKNLKINAIELLPVMEFEGNESWGYNTSFHMALDKFYGTSSKFKELVDICHENGIAVILDLALNHAFNSNPMVRMWMNDPDGDGWGSPSAESPYFNTVAKHSYNVGSDFNHQLPKTQNYVKRVIKQWIEEYKIDGFRWDLTKGFTQNCTANDDSCTNAFQQDRVDVLKSYADYSWSLDPTHYTIFEHLGTDTEEREWANYRIDETVSKGIMMWGKMTDPYNQLTMGYNSNNDISRMNSAAHGFTKSRLVGYAESHDEERLMYKNVQYGANLNGYNVKTASTALSRMSALGAVSLLVPGPKMIWHFGELGMDMSIFSCNNGAVNSSADAIAGDCKLDTKPQPQWVNNWLGDTNRNKIYTDWSKMISMKINEPVFSGTASISSASLTPTIKITNSALAGTQLKDVLVLANFDLSTKNVPTGFPYAGTWYNLMDNTSIVVTDVSAPISMPAGEFRIYGNKIASLAIANFEKQDEIYLYPNPATNYFTLNMVSSKVQVFSITGQLMKSFNASQSASYQYIVSDLSNGMYLVKAYNENDELKVMKFIKK
ncbi:alpha-amylase family glycosyl hydrolase [Flavobacterium sp. W22_SRS_FP1]|uniref:alpha-amylase family glycosyl hydrolase n=1 Tax=Flavobacterium sp. W22_SRS_FP1 TaxID=3240276 RepID=UPI003F93EA40